MKDLDSMTASVVTVDYTNIDEIKKFSSIDADITLLNQYLDSGEWVLLSVSGGVHYDGEAYHSFVIGHKMQLRQIAERAETHKIF